MTFLEESWNISTSAARVQQRAETTSWEGFWAECVTSTGMQERKGSPGPLSLQASLGLFFADPSGLFALPLADHPAELHLTSRKYWHKSCQEIAAQIKCPLQLDF